MFQPFIWGPQGQQLTPDQVERLRQQSAAAAARASDTSPIGHWSAGLARLVDGWGAYRGNQRADAQEAAGLQSASDVVSALMGGNGQSFARVASSSPVVAALAERDPTSAISGAFAGSAAASGQFPASLVQSESGGNWNALNDEGYGGRLQFGAARLADAARAGVIPAGMTGAQFSQLSPEQQQAVEQWHFADIDQQAKARGLDQYIGQTIGGTPITQDAIRAMAHLGGIGGAAKFLQSGGASNPADSNGTSLADYARIHGGGASAPAMGPSMPPSAGVSPVAAALMQAMSDPWVKREYGPVLGALMQQDMSRQNAAYEQYLREQDPMYQAQLAKLTAPSPVDPWAGVQEINGQLVQMTAQGPQVIGDYRTPETPPAMFQTLSPEEVAQLGLPPGAYQRGADGKISQIGGNGVTVNNQLGSNSTKFSEKSDELAAVRFDGLVQEGARASAMMGDMQQLAGLAGQMNTGKGAELLTRFGPYAEMVGVSIDGLPEMQAYQAITSRLVPMMRPAGSGSSSDKDVQGFLDSLPSLSKTPEGNAIINETFQAVQRQKMAAAEIAGEAQRGNITWQDADRKIAALGNPYESFNRMRDKIGGTASTPAAAQPSSIQPGHIEDGYRFKGGNPSDPSSWEQVQ